MLTKERLDRYRKLAKDYPEGNIADLVNHIDYMEREWDQIIERLITTHRALIAFHRYTTAPIQNMVFEIIVKMKEHTS